MSQTRAVLGVPLAFLIGGCAGPQHRIADDNHRLSEEVAELRAQTRRDRRNIRDLEHRLLLAGTGPAAATGGGPVVVEDAPTAPVASADRPVGADERPAGPLAGEPAGEPPGTEPMTTGLEDPGVQIVYEGDAAQPVTRRPRMAVRGRRARSTRDGDAGGATMTFAPSTIEGLTAELPVTRGEVPTVDAQLRRARRAPTRARAAAADPRGEYQRYYAALAAGNHAYAVAGFKNFLERYPDHDYADNAQYWLGESYYDQKDFGQAGIEFRKVVTRYPHGNKVADALLKLGFCHAAVGELDEARTILRQVIAQFPTTASARLASERLIALGRTP